MAVSNAFGQRGNEEVPQSEQRPVGVAVPAVSDRYGFRALALPTAHEPTPSASGWGVQGGGAFLAATNSAETVDL